MSGERRAKRLKRKAHNKNLAKRIRKSIPFYIMILPGLLYLIINNYLPLPGLQLAFKRLNYAEGVWGSPWVGLKNFKYLFRSPDSWIIIRNTLLYNTAFISLGTAFSVTIAILLNECSRKWQKRYQTFILIPHLLSYVVVSNISYVFRKAGRPSATAASSTSHPSSESTGRITRPQR